MSAFVIPDHTTVCMENVISMWGIKYAHARARVLDDVDIWDIRMLMLLLLVRPPERRAAAQSE